jgi:hypothetical protein
MKLGFQDQSHSLDGQGQVNSFIMTMVTGFIHAHRMHTYIFDEITAFIPANVNREKGYEHRNSYQTNTFTTELYFLYLFRYILEKKDKLF